MTTERRTDCGSCDSNGSTDGENWQRRRVNWKLLCCRHASFRKNSTAFNSRLFGRKKLQRQLGFDDNIEKNFEEFSSIRNIFKNYRKWRCDAKMNNRQTLENSTALNNRFLILKYLQ